LLNNFFTSGIMCEEVNRLQAKLDSLKNESIQLLEEEEKLKILYQEITTKKIPRGNS